jgi:copper(I)-binding protein
MKRFFIPLMIAIFILLSACTSSTGSTIEIEDPWARAAAAMVGEMGGHNMGDMGTPTGNTAMGEMQHAGANSGAFMVIRNNGNQADRLIKAESDVAEAVEIHLSEMKDGIMTMRQVDGIDIPANGQAELKPGSYHVMLIGLKRDLVAGEKIRLKLTFEKSGSIEVDAEVRAP